MKKYFENVFFCRENLFSRQSFDKFASCAVRGDNSRLFKDGLISIRWWGFLSLNYTGLRDFSRRNTTTATTTATTAIAIPTAFFGNAPLSVLC